MQPASPGSSVTVHGASAAPHLQQHIPRARQQPKPAPATMQQSPVRPNLDTLDAAVAGSRCWASRELTPACSYNQPTLDQLCSAAVQLNEALTPWGSAACSTPQPAMLQSVPWQSQHTRSKGKATRLLAGLAPKDANELHQLRSWMTTLESKIAAAGRKGCALVT